MLGKPRAQTVVDLELSPLSPSAALFLGYDGVKASLLSKRATGEDLVFLWRA